MRPWLALVPLLACAIACAPPSGDSAGQSDTSDAGTSDAGTSDASTSEPTTAASTGPTCPSGQESCPCGDDLACADELVCVFAVCIALDCEPGSDGCVCGPAAACGPDLACNSGNLCRPDGQCPYTDDGNCDVPEFCPVGSDVNDCCAKQAGICEELGMGGECPPGSDMFDCGYCIYTDDGGCDEPDLCAPGTDKNDCCASVEDGVCDELGMGGQCPQGSDIFDCGYCPTPEDGVCDEIEDSDGLCPPGSDAVDCCAHPKDGVCEEMGMGGMCPPGSDIWDCGYCPWAGDDQCDEPEGTDLCGEGSDPKDCP